jgi:hypothetical protein
MDNEWLRSILGLIAALLVFGGAVLNFINSRLSEAKTRQSRAVVIDAALTVTSVAFSLSGLITSFVGYLPGLGFFWISLLISTIIFFRDQGPIRRWQIVAYI